MAPTTNMNLTLPVVSQTPGPEWASTINSDLSLIDAHDHTSTKGARIPSAALNINANINFAGYSPTLVGYIDFNSQTTSLPGNRQVYVQGGDLYYNNGASTPVQITNGSSVAGSTGTITGLPSGTASASYNAGTSTFAFASATNTPAKMDVGPILVRLNSASSYGVTIQPNASISGNWTLTLPATAPGVASLFCGSVGGAMSYVTTDSTLTLSSSLLKVANLGIDTGQLKDNAVTTAKILDGNVTQAKLGPRTITKSSALSSVSTNSTTGVATTLQCTVTARAGYPLRLEIEPSGINMAALTATTLLDTIAQYVRLYWRITPPVGGVITESGVEMSWIGQYFSWPVNAMSYIWTPASSGSYTIQVYWLVSNISTMATLSNTKLAVYEL